VAQTYKCVDAKGKVTYTGSKCADLKLKDGGEVKERIQYGPGDRAAANAANAPAKPPAPNTVQGTPGAPPAPPAASSAKAEGEDRRCFKTAKGMRCGDKQED